MKKAMILIDYIYDFVADDGALTVGKPAQDISGSIENAITSLDKDDVLVIANDLHDMDTPHPEHKLFPPHALRDTKGRDNWVQSAIDSTKAKVIYLDKTRYSAFFNTGLDKKLKEMDINDIYLSGVCTDICVLHTAVDAYNLDYNTKVLENCVASFDKGGHTTALGHFKNSLGFELVDKI